MKKWFGQFDIFTIFLLLIVFQIPNKKEIKHSSTTHWPNISNPLPACVSHKAFTSLKMWHTEPWKPNLARSGKKSGPIQLASSWAKIVTSHTQNLSDGTMMTTVTELTNRRILFCCGSGRPTSPWKAFHSAKVSRHCFPVVPHRTPPDWWIPGKTLAKPASPSMATHDGWCRTHPTWIRILPGMTEGGSKF